MCLPWDSYLDVQLLLGDIIAKCYDDEPIDNDTVIDMVAKVKNKLEEVTTRIDEDE